jgi:nitrate reductase beta subunit
MHIDAALAEAVMKTMLMQGTVILPVHDSFLVPASQCDRLEDAMLEAAHEVGIYALKVDVK